MDPKVPVVVLVLPEQVAQNPPTKLAVKPKFDWVVVLVLPKWVAPKPPTKPALNPEFDWVVGCKLALKPEFCCPLPTQRGTKVMFGFIPPTLRPMAATGILPGNVVIALAFAAAATAARAATGVPPGDEVMALPFMATAAAAAASAFGGGGVEVSNIVALLRKSWV